jgi:hypothetical protein
LWTLAVRNASAITSRFLNKMNRETGEMYSTPTVFPELRMTYRWQSFCECLSSPKCLQPRPEQDISVLKWGGCYQLTFFDFVFGNSRDEEGCPPQIEQVQKQLLKAVSEVCQKEDATGLLGFLLGSWDAAAITPGIGWREPDRWKELLDSVTCTVDKHSLHALQSYGDKYTLRLDALSKHDQPNRPLVFSQFRLHSRSCDVRAFVEDITSLVNSEQKLRDEVSIIGIFASVGWEDFLVVFRLDGGLSSFLALHKHLLARATSGLPYLRTLSYPLVSAWMAEGQDLATKPLYNDRQLHIGDIKPGWQLQLTTRVRVSEARYIYEIFDKTTAFQKKHESLCNGTVFEPILVFGEHDLIVRTRLNENGEFAAFWKLIDELIKDEHTLSCESSVSLVQTAIKEWIL